MEKIYLNSNRQEELIDQILDKNKSMVSLEYKSNEFDELGNRIIKICKLNLPTSFNNLSDKKVKNSELKSTIFLQLL